MTTPTDHTAVIHVDYFDATAHWATCSCGEWESDDSPQSEEAALAEWETHVAEVGAA